MFGSAFISNCHLAQPPARFWRLLSAVMGGLLLVGLLPLALNGFQARSALASAPVTAAGDDPDPGPGQVALELTKTVNHPTPALGETILYTLIVTNHGPDPAEWVVIGDTLPPGLVYQDSTPGYDPFAGEWLVEGLGVGQSAVLTITAEVAACSQNQAPITNTAIIQASEPGDPDSADNVAEASIIPCTEAADLAVSKTVNKATPFDGESITYTIVVTNLGPEPATGVRLTDTLPFSLTFGPTILSQGLHTQTARDLRWYIGGLGPNEAATLTLTATVEIGAMGYTLANAARVAASSFDPNLNNNTAGVSIYVPKANLALSKTASNPTPDAGEEVDYQITLTNHGPDEARDIIVYERIPSAGLTYLSHQFSRPFGMRYTENGIWTVDRLAKGESVRLTLSARMNRCSLPVLTNTARLAQSRPTDVTPADNEASAAVAATFDVECYVYLPVIMYYNALINGDFETCNLKEGWTRKQGPFEGNGSGLPQAVIPSENGCAALLGDPSLTNPHIPVGYGYIAQTFTVISPYLQIQYHVHTYDIVRGVESNYYFDTFEVSLNKSPDKIRNQEREKKGCASKLLNPNGPLVADEGLAFCGGFAGSAGDVGILHDLGLRTVTLDLQKFLGSNLTLYLTLWSREYGDRGQYNQTYYNTWVHIDNIQFITGTVRQTSD